MFKKISKIILLIIFFSFFVLPSILTFAQTVQGQERVNLEQQLKELEERIAQYDKDITRTDKEKKTLKNQISVLKSKIGQLDTQIKKGNVTIQDLGFQIKDTESSIGKTSFRIENTKEKLTAILRTLSEEDQKSLLEILVAEPKLSNFFDNLVALEALHQKSQDLLKDIKVLKSDLETQKQNLDEEKEEVGKVVKVQTLQKQQSEEVRKEQEQVLKMTEAQYQQSLKEREGVQKQASEIRKRIFELAQVLDVDTPTFEEAYALASFAGNATGVRPALILGLLEIESAIGKNVGQCNCAGKPSCRYPNLTYKDIMRSNQWASFESIVAELGMNPNSTPVSCSVNGGKVQWGGAMGPAQFMPNTWLNLGYKSRVENSIGTRPASPWRVKDAFLAAASYLSDWDAVSQNRQNEIGAVTAYLCGTNRMTASCTRAGGSWYRNSVMQKADQWQKWIEQGVFNR
mgnify:CR=1 FL=1